MNDETYPKEETHTANGQFAACRVCSARAVFVRRSPASAIVLKCGHSLRTDVVLEPVPTSAA